MRCLSAAVLSISVLSQGCFLASRKPVTRYDRVVSFVAGGVLIAGGASLVIYDRNNNTDNPNDDIDSDGLDGFIGEVGIVLGIAFVVHGLLLHDWTPPVAQPPMYPVPTPGPYPAPAPGMYPGASTYPAPGTYPPPVSNPPGPAPSAPGTYAPPPSNALPAPSAPATYPPPAANPPGGAGSNAAPAPSAP